MRHTRLVVLFAIVIAVALASHRGSAAQMPAQKAGKLIVYGDMTYFWGPGKRQNCNLNNRYGRGEPVGWRISAIDPETGEYTDPATTDVIVHLTYAGSTQDIKMRWRATAQQPERTFWVAKWVVPNDAPLGIVRFTVSAKDKNGRMGEFKPYEVAASQLTIVE